MTGLDSPANSQRPVMAAAFPEAVTRIVEALRQMGYPDLADSLPSQQFYGRCQCKPGCSFALTAPPGSAGSLMIWLEASGEIIGEASLDPQGKTITNFDIGNPKKLDIPPNWLERGLSHLPPSPEDR